MSISGVVLVCIAAFFPSASLAAGESLHLTVVNSLAIPQFGVYIKHDSKLLTYTDGGGEATLELGSTITAGETLELARYPGKEPPPPVPCAPPADVTSYTVPDPAPTAATVAIPALASTLDPPHEPGLSDPELKFLGLMNNLRRSLGAQPLQASTTLDAEADRYLSRLKSVSTEEEPHCVVASPPLRAVDAGFPSGSIGENLAFNGMCSAEGTYEAFYSEKGKPEDGHYQNMIFPEYTTVGVATDGTSWVIDFAALPLNDPFLGRAGLTGQFGDSSLPDADCEFESPRTRQQDTHSDPRLRITHLTAARSVIHLAVHVEPGAVGQVIATAKRIEPLSRTRQLHLEEKRASRQVAFGVGPGEWRITVRFVPQLESAWKRATVRRQIRVSRRAPSARH